MHPDRGGDEQQAGNHEVADLDPAQAAEAQQAQRVTCGVEPVAGQHLEQAHDDEQRAGGNAAGQQRSGRVRGRRRGWAVRPSARCGEVLGHRGVLSLGATLPGTSKLLFCWASGRLARSPPRTNGDGHRLGSQNVGSRGSRGRTSSHERRRRPLGFWMRTCFISARLPPRVPSGLNDQGCPAETPHAGSPPCRLSPAAACRSQAASSAR